MKKDNLKTLKGFRDFLPQAALAREEVFRKIRTVFQKYGCTTCHGTEGRGGIKNPNAQTGEEVPNLIYVKEGFSEKELKDRIESGMKPEKLSPEGPAPLRVMPAWRGIIEENEINNLMAYLFSLYPKEAEEEW